MAYMGEIGSFRLDNTNYFQSFFQVKVGYVWAVLQGIQNKDFGAVNFLHFQWRDIIGISYVSKILNPIAEYRKLVMQRSNGGEVDSLDRKSTRLNSSHVRI